jgi:DNA primase catalytic core
MNKEYIQKIKDANPIEDIIKEDVAELKQNGNVFFGYHSNKHDSESKSSLRIDPEKQLYYCFNCTEGGDVIDWLECNRNMSFTQACRYLAERAGIAPLDVDPEKQKEYENQRKERRQLEALYKTAAEIYNSQLTEEHYKLLLNEWGLNRKTVDRFKIGYAPVGTFLKDKLLEEGFSKSLIYKSGLVNKGGYEHFQGRLVFPYYYNTQVVYFTARKTDQTPDKEWEKGKYKKLLTHSDKNQHVSKTVTNGHFAGEDSAKGADVLLITEGIPDCYAAIQAGYACISPGTVNFSDKTLPRLERFAKKVKHVYIVNDTEESGTGYNAALKTAELLLDKGIEVKIILLPKSDDSQKMDLADYLKEHTPENLQGLLEESKTVFEICLDKLRENPGSEDELKIAYRLLSKSSINQSKKDKCVNQLYKIVKDVGIMKPTIRSEIAKLQKSKTKDTDKGDGDDSDEEKQSVTQKLVEIASSECEFFHDENKNAYATIEVNGHFENYAVRSRDFKLWLRRRLLQEYEETAYGDALQAAVESIESQAIFCSPEKKVFVRIAANEGDIWLDLADKQWRAVKITSSGWEVMEGEIPVKFIRPKGMLSLPAPARGGDLQQLREFINVGSEDDFILIVSWLLAALKPEGSYPILAIYGEQGSAKSTACRVLRRLIDPNSADLRSAPRDERDLVISASNGLCLAFDNISKIFPSLSDALCRLSTGGGFATRQLYTDSEEQIFESKRPILVNGITDIATRADLLDRAVVIKLPAIPKSKRKTDSELWDAFEKSRPYILGSLLDAVSTGLKNLPDTKLETPPRMADFARWVVACEEAIDCELGTFMSAYSENREEANLSAIENSLVGSAIITFMGDKDYWEGTYKELLGKLEKQVGEKTTKQKYWPKSPKKFSAELRRVIPNLRSKGIEVIEKGHKENGNSIALQKNSHGPSVHSGETYPQDNSGNGSDLRNGSHPEQTNSSNNTSEKDSGGKSLFNKNLSETERPEGSIQDNGEEQINENPDVSDEEMDPRARRAIGEDDNENEKNKTDENAIEDDGLDDIPF